MQIEVFEKANVDETPEGEVRTKTINEVDLSENDLAEKRGGFDEPVRVTLGENDEKKSPDVDVDSTEETKPTVEETEPESEMPIRTTRFRKDMGDLTGLKESISEIGQIHPIIIDSKGTLITGARRLQACTELGVKPIYRTINFDNPDKVDKAEIDENTQRKDFTASEIFEINKYFNERLSKQFNKGKDGKFTVSVNDANGKKQPRDIVADVTGVGTKTLSKINKIYNSGNEEVKKKVDTKELSIDKAYSLLKKTNKPNGNAGGKNGLPQVKNNVNPTGNTPELPAGESSSKALDTVKSKEITVMVDKTEKALTALAEKTTKRINDLQAEKRDVEAKIKSLGKGGDKTELRTQKTALIYEIHTLIFEYGYMKFFGNKFTNSDKKMKNFDEVTL